MIKYASNALLACLISFSNEVANLGSALSGIDASDVMRGVHLSQYFRGRNDQGLPPITAFLKPGCGFGGSCLPKDVSALIAHGRAVGEDMALLDAIIRINVAQPGKVVDLLHKHWPSLDGVRVTVLGLAFKPGTSDVRESPAFAILRELLTRGATVTAHDPVANREARAVMSDPAIRYVERLSEALQDADAVVVVTPWPDFDAVPEILSERDPQPVLVDCRRAFAKGSVTRYEGVGL
jgi:UDPglucose 6-dehydrogenase/GDP-mannose 6-dehydrogenase